MKIEVDLPYSLLIGSVVGTLGPFVFKLSDARSEGQRGCVSKILFHWSVRRDSGDEGHGCNATPWVEPKDEITPGICERQY